MNRLQTRVLLAAAAVGAVVAIAFAASPLADQVQYFQTVGTGGSPAASSSPPSLSTSSSPSATSAASAASNAAPRGGLSNPGAPTFNPTGVTSGAAQADQPGSNSRTGQTAQSFAMLAKGKRVGFSPEHHDYPATDIFAPCGTPVYAPVSGVVSYVNTVDIWNPKTNLGADRGGVSFAVDAGSVRFYASHLDAMDLKLGQVVQAGQTVGTVGKTGSARSTPCHIHFGISPTACQIDAWWIRRGVIKTYPYLRAWEKGTVNDPTPEVLQWHTQNGCPATPPA